MAVQPDFVARGAWMRRCNAGAPGGSASKVIWLGCGNRLRRDASPGLAEIKRAHDATRIFGLKTAFCSRAPAAATSIAQA
jgi:hypothetical protein